MDRSDIEGFNGREGEARRVEPLRRESEVAPPHTLPDEQVAARGNPSDCKICLRSYVGQRDRRAGPPRQGEDQQQSRSCARGAASDPTLQATHHGAGSQTRGHLEVLLEEPPCERELRDV